ncbi:MAG: hypothetical protein K6E98_00905 [Lachnospiraceae bacterium]|nr:hypothetical protein [Lachnospiraceae bacterium]
MINFEDELRKFHPSMEIEGVEEAVNNHDMTDMTDIFLAMMREKADAEVQARAQGQAQAQAQMEQMMYTSQLP